MASCYHSEALLNVKQAQTKRALAYASWEQSFQQYLRDPSTEPDYARSCSAAQDDLQQASLLVIRQIDLLKSWKEPKDWVERLQQLQNFERQKLELTVKRIMVRWKCKHESPQDLALQQQDLQLRRDLAEIVDDINAIVTEIDFDLHDESF